MASEYPTIPIEFINNSPDAVMVTFVQTESGQPIDVLGCSGNLIRAGETCESSVASNSAVYIHTISRAPNVSSVVFTTDDKAQLANFFTKPVNSNSTVYTLNTDADTKSAHLQAVWGTGAIWPSSYTYTYPIAKTPLQWSCSRTGLCSQTNNGRFETESLCQASCAASPGTALRYDCDAKGKCMPSYNGRFTTNKCTSEAYPDGACVKFRSWDCTATPLGPRCMGVKGPDGEPTDTGTYKNPICATDKHPTRDTCVIKNFSCTCNGCVYDPTGGVFESMKLCTESCKPTMPPCARDPKNNNDPKNSDDPKEKPWTSPSPSPAAGDTPWYKAPAMVYVGIAVAVLIVAGVLLWMHFRNNAATTSGDATGDATTAIAAVSTTTTSNAS
jgi:hypothetical protein